MRASLRPRVVVGLLCLALTLTALAAPPRAAGQPNVIGQWSMLSYLSPLNPVHVALLHNGKVLIVGGSENKSSSTTYKTAVWDPIAGTFNEQVTPWDLFCNSMTMLPDGRVFITGGNLSYGPQTGPPWTTIFDPLTERFYRVEDMARGRWYPTNALLADGGTMVFGGHDEQTEMNNTVEIYDVGGGWSPPYEANFSPKWYPRLHLLGNGKVFMSAPNPQSRTFNPDTATWSASGATTNYGVERQYGSSVLLPLHPDDGYRPRVVILGGGTNVGTETVEVIDLGAQVESWRTLPPMNAKRTSNNAVLLPTGKILSLGGSAEFNVADEPSMNAQLLDPVSETWAPAGRMAYARLYHSSALLLPDATVWVAGSNPNTFTWTPQMEIYKPPYLFTSTGAPAPRPTISALPATIGYGATFTVTTPQAASISQVVFMRPGSATHGFDQEQRLVHAYFTKGTGSLAVTAPTKQGAAPPGYYMIFLIDDKGVPSVAKFLQLLPHPTNQPPTAAITSPSGDVSVQAGQSLTFTGTANDPDGSIAASQWIFPGGNPGKSTVLNPGAVTFSTPGVYTVSFTVLDNLGVNNPSPPTVRVTVTGTPGLTATIQNPANGATVGGTVNVAMAAGNAQGFPIQLTLKLDGATTLSTQSIASGSTASYAWNTTGLANGGHTLTLTVTDGAGRTATQTANVTVNNGGAPTVAITAPATNAWTGSSIRVTASASSLIGLTTVKLWGNGAPFFTATCSGTSCTADTWWSTSALPKGQYQVHAVATDTAGQSTLSVPIVINKNGTTPFVPSGAAGGTGGGGGGGGDTTAPTASVTAPTGGATVSGSVSVTASATDNVGVAGVQFKLNGANLGAEDTTAPYGITWDTTAIANGTHTLTAVARDAAGNTTTSAAVTVTVSNGGGGGGGGGGGPAPTVTITTPASPAWTGSSLRVTATASSSTGLASVKLWGNGVAFFTATCSGTSCTADTWWSTSALPKGQYEVHAVATDTAGQSALSAPILVNKNGTSPFVPSGATTGGGGGGPTPDTTAPTASITAPASGATVSGSVTISADATDNVGVVGVQFKLNGVNLGPEDTTAPYAIAWDTVAAGNGAHALTAVARDAAGNTTTSAVVTVTVANGGGGGSDVTPPSVTMVNPQNNAWTGNSIRVQVTASDNVGLATLVLYGNGTPFATVNCNGAPTCGFDNWWSTSALPKGKHTISATATDTSGNQTTPPSVTINK